MSKKVLYQKTEKETKMIKLENKNTNKENFENFRWICNACTASRTAYRIDCIKIEKNQIIGTDAQQLRIAKIIEDKYEPGLYEIEKNTKSKILLTKIEKGKFPKYNDLFPKNNRYFTYTPNGTPENLALFLAYNGVFINPKFVADLPGEEYTVYFEKDKPVMLKNKNRTFLIMSMNLSRSMPDIQKIQTNKSKN